MRENAKLKKKGKFGSQSESSLGVQIIYLDESSKLESKSSRDGGVQRWSTEMEEGKLRKKDF